MATGTSASATTAERRDASHGTTGSAMLPCRIRLEDGRMFSGELPAARHRRIQIGMLHGRSVGLVEIAVGFRHDGKLTVPRRKYSQFLPGGKTGGGSWLEDLLDAAEQHSRRAGGEVFIAPPVRDRPAGAKDAVTGTDVLWIDTDKPGQLHRLWAMLAERPCHLLVESGGSGGCHAYFALAEPLPATRVIQQTGELVEPIERAHRRLIHRLGLDTDGGTIADPQCVNRSRLMRLAGTVNGKTGRHARIIEANFELAPYRIEELVGDLPDPPGARIRRPGPRPAGENPDPYKQIPPPQYFEVLAGITVPPDGMVRCPNPQHADRNPSCVVYPTPQGGWFCYACPAGGGAIYDLASVLLGGPTGQQLRGEHFKRAKEYVRDAFGVIADPDRSRR